MMQLFAPARPNTRWSGHFRLRVRKDSHANGVFISKKETLLGVLLLTLSVLALHWIVSGSASAPDREPPVSASAYRA